MQRGRLHRLTSGEQREKVLARNFEGCACALQCQKRWLEPCEMEPRCPPKPVHLLLAMAEGHCRRQGEEYKSMGSSKEEVPPWLLLWTRCCQQRAAAGRPRL